LFAEGSEHDFSHFREGCVVTVRIVAGADLHLPMGRVVAAEPWACFEDGAEAHAFVQQVEPGTYPVQLVMADYYDPGNPQGYRRFGDGAAARVVSVDKTVAVWRLALRDGEDYADLADDEYYGYRSTVIRVRSDRLKCSTPLTMAPWIYSTLWTTWSTPTGSASTPTS
jgi:uncharacterized protein DUF4241